MSFVKPKMESHSDMSEKGESSNNVVMGRPKEEDESESRSNGDNFLNGVASEDEPDSVLSNSSRKRKYSRHTANQILELETAFKENPHPNEKVRLELGKKLSMDSKQVKFWFQNRRTQMKSHLERHENGILKQENDRLRIEHIAMQGAMKHPICNRCRNQAIIADINVEEHQTKIEYERLKEEVKRISVLADKLLGPLSSLEGSMASVIANPAFGLPEGINGFGGINYANAASPMGLDFDNGLSSPPPVIISRSLANVDASYDKSMLMDLALAAMNELLGLAEIGEPLWVRSLDGGGETLNLEEYARSFTPCTGMKPGHFATEATRATGTVIVNSLTLVETLMDMSRWVEMFSCIVGKTSVVNVIPGSTCGSWSSNLQLIQTEFQIISDLVPAREMKFLRFCKQQAEGVWAVVDVSVDTVQESSQPHEIGNCRRLPSGCIVQDMPNGYSKVTWIEHMEYYENVLHHLYRPLVRNGLGFGAQRWMATLQRQSEFLAMLMSSVDSPVVCSSGQTSMAMLAQRMTRNFCAGVCATIHKWESIQQANGEDAKLMMRKNIGDPGEPIGVVLSATKTIWLPVKQQRLLDFLLNEQTRSQWDILFNSGPMQQLVHIAKGQNIDNSISLFRANVDAISDSENNMLILQDTCTDATGSLIVYATIDAVDMDVVMNGGDSSSVAFLPSGIAIVPDCFQDYSGANNCNVETSWEKDNGFSGTGSLVTIGFQVLVNSSPAEKLSMESVQKVNNLISHTIHGIKASFKSK
nr:PREDICTED: homeobox-leucine zipper protein ANTHOCYANINLESS 2-like isoform X1 [Nicotiana sylvestris]